MTKYAHQQAISLHTVYNCGGQKARGFSGSQAPALILIHKYFPGSGAPRCLASGSPGKIWTLDKINGANHISHIE